MAHPLAALAPAAAATALDVRTICGTYMWQLWGRFVVIFSSGLIFCALVSESSNVIDWRSWHSFKFQIWRNMLTIYSAVFCVCQGLTFLLTLLSTGSFWCFAPHSSVFGFVEPYSPPTVSFQRLCRFSCCVSQGFSLCCASAPIDNLHFIVCVNCSAAQWVLCVTVEMSSTMSPSEFLF